jgi:outer membrane receptor protein involved in Fe transport
VRTINLPAGLLPDSIRSLSDQTGVSVGFAGHLPQISTRTVHLAHSAAEALRQMLDGSGYRAIATGPSSFRIERAPPHAERPVPQTAQSSAGLLQQQEIIVTARKRPEPLSSLPGTEHVIRSGRLPSATGIAGSDTLAREIPSVSISGLGPGRNRLFLRGIGDGPLNGFNQGSVAILLDEARLNYDAPDPDWALVDIDQVEVLEGPQGPLYGTGALGGIIKVSTNRPDPTSVTASASAGLSLIQDGGLSNSQSVTLNLPLLPTELAVRAVAYRELQAGWIDNVGGTHDSNRERLTGVRLGIRWSPQGQWTVDLSGAIQSRSARDSQYVDGRLGPLERPNRLREPRDLDAKLEMMTIKGPLGGLELTSVTSFSRQEAVAAYDATPLAALLGVQSQAVVEDDRNYHLFDQEFRLNHSRAGRFEWLAGLSIIRASTDAEILVRGSASALPLLALKRSVTEAALYGEASLAITPSLTLGGGARLFSSAVDDDAEEGRSLRSHGSRTIRGAGDASLIWNPVAGTTVFVRAASAYRPGGINVEPDATEPAYEADELASIELGSRATIVPGLSLEASLYAARWQHIQADELLLNGLIATRNAGTAREFGLEGEVRWTLGTGFVLASGFLIQSARLEATGQPSTIDDSRIPAVPQAAARIRLDRSFRLGAWDARTSLGFRYSGATHLSFDPVLDRRTGGHGTVDGSVALSRDGWTLALVGDNLTNSSADTFAFGNPYRVRAEPERTPARPRTIGITVSGQF